MFSVLMRFRGAVSGCRFGVPFRVPWRPLGTPDGRFLGTLEGVPGHAEVVHAPPLHEKMHAPVCTLLEIFRPSPRAQVRWEFNAQALFFELPRSDLAREVLPLD